jgi:lipopolysaccharide export LptBFGC system permease protein LptF
MIKLNWQNWFEIFCVISMSLFGVSTIYGFLTNQGIEGLIGILFMFVIYLLMDNRKLNKQINELETKVNKLDIKD